MKNIILSFICLIAFVSSCSKYDDGPAFSLLTKTQRVTGIWDLKKMIVNGEEENPNITDTYNGTYPCWDTAWVVTDYPYNLISTESTLTTWEFEKDGDFSLLDYNTGTWQTLDSFSCVDYQAYISDFDTSYVDSYYSDWEFSSNKEEIEIDLGLGLWDFEISRLTNKEMTLDLKIDGDKLELQLEKQ